MRTPIEMWGIRGFSALGLLNSWHLSTLHWNSSEGCVVLVVPTCYLITVLFAMILMNSFFFHRSCGRIDFDLAVGAGVLLTTTTSVGALLFNIRCPAQELSVAKIPHCYTEAALFLVILALYRRIRKLILRTCTID